ncbi:hypothetical protein [Nocardia veterana]|uniref:Uncharacterized protein n=1 Tax=Nocardia veterana TaxID=132249 RepID=A0A7X6LWZ8_9NOCA|nr:hypothetical protein [Nocardia veterana]NKY85664.1 hypothetical protein [Nocardia veterana]
MRISLIAAACIALPLLGACSSDKDSQPPVTQADLSKSLQASGLKDAKLADCAAKLYVDEGISQDGLRKMTKPGGNAQATDGSMGGLSKDDADKARSATQKIATECVAAPQPPQ